VKAGASDVRSGAFTALAVFCVGAPGVKSGSAGVKSGAIGVNTS